MIFINSGRAGQRLDWRLDIFALARITPMNRQVWAGLGDRTLESRLISSHLVERRLGNCDDS